ncbi:MAG TPA: hypothetical protein VK946_01030 [Methylotenera sp.]|nr:hypothetical protein [Methylotenera sp.]
MALFPILNVRIYVIVLLVFIAFLVFSRLAVEVANKSEGRSYIDYLMLTMMGLSLGVTNFIKMPFLIKLFLIMAVIGSLYYLVIYLFDQPGIKTKMRYFVAAKINVICITIGIFCFAVNLGMYLVN